MHRSPLLPTLLALMIGTGVVLAASCLPEPHELVGRPCDAEHACGDVALVCCRGTCQPVSVEASCDGPEAPGDGGDGGLGDGGLGDGGVGDGGLADGGALDGGVTDAGMGDGGMGQDGGTSVDGGLPDAGMDAGCPPNLLTTGGFEKSTDLSQYLRTGAGSLSRVSSNVRTGSWALQVQRIPTEPDTFFGAMLSETVISPVQAGATYCMAVWLKRGDILGELVLNSRRYGPGGPGDWDRTYEHSIAYVPTDDAWFPLIGVMVPTTTFSHSVNFRTSVKTNAGSVYYVDDARVWKAPGAECEARCAF